MTHRIVQLISLGIFLGLPCSVLKGATTQSSRRACENICWSNYTASTQNGSSEQNCSERSDGTWIPLLGCYILNEDRQESFRACRANLETAQDALQACLTLCRGNRLNIGIITLAQ